MPNYCEGTTDYVGRPLGEPLISNGLIFYERNGVLLWNLGMVKKKLIA